MRPDPVQSLTPPSAPLEELQDLTLWHWRFFPNRRAREEEKSGQDWQAFSRALEGALHWAGAPQAPVTAVVPGDQPRASTVRTASLSWHTTGDGLRCLEARALLDSYYIQTGCAQEGAVGPGTGARLAQADFPGVDAHSLGESVCLVAEWRGEPDPARAQALAVALVEGGAHGAGRLELVELDCGLLGVPLESEDQAWVLLVRPGDCARRQAAHLLHRLIPPLLLAYVKARGLVRSYEAQLWPRAAEEESRLNAKLQHIAEQGERLERLEGISDDIAHHQAKYVEAVSQCEEVLESLQANLANLERQLEDPLFAGRTALDTLLAAPLRLSVRQLTTDLRYLGITQTQADRVQRSLATMAEVRAGRWNRHTTMLLGAFVAFEFLQVFPELPVPWRIGLSVLLDSVKQDGRFTDKHLGRSTGMMVGGYSVMVVAPCS